MNILSQRAFWFTDGVYWIRSFRFWAFESKLEGRGMLASDAIKQVETSKRMLVSALHYEEVAR